MYVVPMYAVPTYDVSTYVVVQNSLVSMEAASNRVTLVLTGSNYLFRLPQQ